MNSKTFDPKHAWLRCYQPRQYARVQLVCFPPEGASASFYRTWCARLPVTVELLAVQYPGRDDRMDEACIEDICLLADLAADALMPPAPRALVLFGHGLGAALAFEVALRLERRLAAPAVRLFVSGRSPDREPDDGFHGFAAQALLDNSCGSAGSAEEPVAKRALSRVLRNDYRLNASYQPKAKLHCPISAYVGIDDFTVSMDQARRWSNFTHGDFRARSFPGDHFYLNSNAGMVLAELLQALHLADKNRAVWLASA